jgi:hypothetical protein
MARIAHEASSIGMTGSPTRVITLRKIQGKGSLSQNPDYARANSDIEEWLKLYPKKDRDKRYQTERLSLYTLQISYSQASEEIQWQMSSCDPSLLALEDPELC